MSEQTPEQIRNQLLGKKLVQEFTKRNFEAYYCPNAQEALKKALELIPKNSTVSWGGSATIQEIGLLEALNQGDYVTYDRQYATTPQEKREIYLKALTADFYLTSANGISEDGVIINIDGTGNRVAAICYGPQNVIVISGINKVASTEEAALMRARSTAAPINQARFLGKTPCSSTGVCGNCKSEECICNQILITRNCRPKNRIKVILVGESLGY